MPSVVDDSEYDPPKNNKRGEARISQPLRFEVASADSGGFLGIAFGWTFDIASCRHFVVGQSVQSQRLLSRPA